MIMLSVNTTITVGTVEKIIPDKNELELSLNIPIIALKGDNAGIARNVNNHWRLIGFGEIIE
jgi:translation initiation factor 2 gamma subunit (eIF-2gamma)